MQTLSPKTWLHDGHIEYIVNELQQEITENDPQIWYVKLCTAHFLKHAKTEKEVEEVLDEEEAVWKEYITIPINDQGAYDKNEGGCRWSLLTFNREEKTWYLMDSHKSDETMKKEAKKLAKRMNDSLFEYSEEKPKFVVSDCSKQNNGYDCGAYVMLFLQTIKKKIVKKERLDTCMINERDVKTIRKWIRGQIEKEIKMLPSEKEIDNKKIDKNKCDEKTEKHKKLMDKTNKIPTLRDTENNYFRKKQLCSCKA